ncbi:MAG TPA: peptide-methionine (R)-S-oxide reductase MsrB [Methylophilus sp.]
MLKWKNVLKLAREGNYEPNYKVRKSPRAWRDELDEEVFAITRLSATERPFSSEMCQAFAPGLYACACCQQELFNAGQKFSSASGWPSFDQPLAPNAIAYFEDVSHGMERIEVKCNVCDAHLGHVFPDGKTESGLRYCINGKAITFIAQP